MLNVVIIAKKMKNKQKLIFILIGGIIFLAFLLRVYNINTAPPGIYPDEAVNAQDALRALDSGNFKWFYPDNDGREGLFMNLIALSFAIFGVSAFSLKLPAIVLGTLTVWGTYLLTKELFKNNKIALLAAFFNAVSFGAIIFSRISFRANLLPFVLVWSFYFLFKGFHSKKFKHFIIAGAFFGLGMHGYIAFRLAPFILVGVLPFLILARKNFLRDFYKPILVFVISFVVVALPMFYTFYIHPEFFFTRTNEISVFSAKINGGHPWKILAHTFKLSFMKYNFVPDTNWRNNFPPYPILNPALGIFFLGGIIYSAVIFMRLLFLRIRKKVYSDEMVVHIFLFVWFFIMLVPEFMSFENNPHALRAIGALSVVFIWSAFFAINLWQKIIENITSGKKLVGGFFILIFLFIGIFDGCKYFVFWANHIQSARSFEKNVTEMAHYIESLPKDKNVYAIAGNMQRVVVRIFNWNRSGFYDLNPIEISNFDFKNQENMVFVFTDFKKDDIIYYLENKFGKMELREIKDEYGLRYFVLYRGN